MSASDPKLHRVRRAFDGVHGRLRAVTTDDDFEDELTCLLHHLYRLSELCWRRRGYSKAGGLYRFLHQSSDRDLRAAGAATWARTFDTHEVIVVATPIDTYSDIYGDIYGAPSWKPLAELPKQTDRWGHQRHEDYEQFLEGRDIVPTIRSAFDAMVQLIP